VDLDFFVSRVADLEAEACRQEKEVLTTYGMLIQSSEGADPRTAPLRCALAVWGLTADDIGVLSIHGTVPALRLTRRMRHICETRS
jgi:fatty acid synthase subunit alpha, fungi type